MRKTALKERPCTKSGCDGTMKERPNEGGRFGKPNKHVYVCNKCGSTEVQSQPGWGAFLKGRRIV